jgi:hypothetical protein
MRRKTPSDAEVRRLCDLSQRLADERRGDPGVYHISGLEQIVALVGAVAIAGLIFGIVYLCWLVFA